MNTKLYLGAHLSCAKGFHKMGKEALAAHMNTMQFFCAIRGVPRQKHLTPRICRHLTRSSKTTALRL